MNGAAAGKSTGGAVKSGMTLPDFEALVFYDEYVICNGRKVAYDQISDILFNSTHTRKSINGIPIGSSYESNFSIKINETETVYFKQEFAFTGFGQKKKADAIWRASEILSDITFTSRLKRYEKSFSEKGFFSVGDYQVCRNGDLFRKSELILNLKDNNVKILAEPFAIRMEVKSKARSIWQGVKNFFSSAEFMPTDTNKDCIMYMLKNNLGITWPHIRVREKRKPKKEIFNESLLRLGGRLCKIDGHISAEEVRVFKHYFGIDEATYPGAGRIFMEAANSPVNISSIAQEIASLFGGEYEPLEYIILGLMRVADADGFEKSEEDFIIQVCRGFKFADAQITRLFTLFNLSYAPHTKANAGGGGAGRRAMGNLRQRYLMVFGLSDAASLEQIKTAYREMARRHHPDLLRAQGIPLDQIKDSEEILKVINEAYRWLCQTEQAVH